MKINNNKQLHKEGKQNDAVNMTRCHLAEIAEVLTKKRNNFPFALALEKQNLHTQN